MLITGPLIESLSKIFKVLGDANRLGIIMAIGREAVSVSEIIDKTGLPQTLVSFHLKILREARIVKTERDGPFIYYSLLEESLIDILADLYRVAGANNKGGQ